MSYPLAFMLGVIVGLIGVYYGSAAFEEWFQNYPRIDQPGGEDE